jgi:hypothetical protein
MNDKIICPIIFDERYNDKKLKNQSFKDYYEGKYFYTNQGYLIKVLEYNNATNIDIEFIYNGYIKTVVLKNLKNGMIANPFHPAYHGGFMGVGDYSSKNCFNAYLAWISMLTRIKNNRSYNDTFVCSEWYNFQNFANWYKNKINLLNPNFKYEVDKDIKQIGIHPKIYSPETCVIIPHKLNAMLERVTYNNSKKSEPLGVIKNFNKYIVRMKINMVSTTIGYFDNEIDAFNAYKHAKLSLFRETSTYFYNQNAILYDDYISCMNMDLLPHNN